ncbi:MAG: hypothetical protein LBC70_01390 [Chitinispirillales bacterium]|jgi:hypothetical protein|nr:hypothetical protein [Chitinispirillales bacterium]
MYKKIILLLMCLVGTFFIIYKCVDTKKSKKGNAADVGNTDNDYASQKTESKTTETEEKNDMEPKITKMYWAYWNGEKYIELEENKKNRHYIDLNLHVETENYDGGCYDRKNILGISVSINDNLFYAVFEAKAI